MNTTKDLASLKSSRPDVYKALSMIARSLQCFHGEDRRALMISTYANLKTVLLHQQSHLFTFLNRTYLDIHDRSDKSLAFKLMSKRQERKWKAKQQA
jgi:hypothetical protein